MTHNYDAKEVVFDDDFAVAGKVGEIKEYCEMLRTVGPKYGYYPKASKYHLIVKQQYYANVIDIFGHTEVQVTAEGERHIGTVIGSKDYKKKYVDSLMESWNQQLKLLSKIALIEPQTAYSAFVGGFKSKLNYAM